MTYPQISVVEINKQYAQVHAVNSLSFDVNRGEIFALLGPNGAGKSSLVRMLIGFTAPDSGKITVTLDQTYSHIPKSHLGYLPEDRGLYPEKSIVKNLMYFAKLRGVSKVDAIERVDYWLAKFDLLERKNDLLKSLSKGNQQKVQLITAVLHEPDIVLLDEPFSGLDPINQEKVVVFLSELKAKGMTVILSAHQMAMVEKLADRMLLMNKGQAVLYGTLDDIRQQTSSGFVISATFASALTNESLTQESLTNVTQPLQYELLNDNQLKISLDSAQQLPALTEQLVNFGELIHITSQQQDLHQLYLRAVEHHESQPNEIAKEKQYA